MNNKELDEKIIDYLNSYIESSENKKWFIDLLNYDSFDGLINGLETLVKKYSSESAGVFNQNPKLIQEFNNFFALMRDCISRYATRNQIYYNGFNKRLSGLVKELSLLKEKDILES